MALLKTTAQNQHIVTSAQSPCAKKSDDQAKISGGKAHNHILLSEALKVHI